MEYYIQPGVLTGIGGSVIFSTKKSTAGSGDDPNAYFTAAVVGSVLFAAASRGGLLLFEKPILRFFGADSSLLPLAITYMKPILYVLPVFSQSGAHRYSYLRRLVFVAAVQYFLRLLFSVDLKTEGGIYHFRRARACRHRGFHPAFAALLRLLFRMACHAADGACNGALRCRADEKVYRGGINRIPAPLA